MNDLITTLFSSFTETIKGMGTGIKEAFLNILYVNPSAETLVVSDFAKFMFLMFGLGLAIGLIYGAVRLIRR